MPRTVDHVARRAEFISAGWRVISGDGFDAASMRRIAQEAGYTTGSLTHYFADRQAFLVESLRAAQAQAGARMRTAAAAAETDYDRLRGVVLEALPLTEDTLIEWKVWLAFWGAAMNDPDLAAENTARYDEWRQVMERVLAPLCTDVKAEADHLVALIDGLGLSLARGGKDPRDLTRKQKACIAVIDRHLATFRSREG